MAYLQLSGKMLRLNGNQYLRKAWPAGNYPSLSACWVRIASKINEFPQADSRTVLHIVANTGKIEITYFQDLSYGGDLIRVSSATSNTSKITILGLPSWYSSTGLTAPIGSNTIDVVWNGDILCVYLNGTLAGKYSGITGRIENNSVYFGVNIGQYDYGSGIKRFLGDVGDCIIHDAVPSFLADFPRYIPNANLKATEFLKLHGLTENDVLCLYDYRDPSNPGKNYGSGGSDWDLTAYGNPTILDTDFQYELVDEPPLIARAYCDDAAGPHPHTVNFTCEAFGGTETYQYQWYYRAAGAGTWNTIGGATDPTLKWTIPSVGDWEVRCKVSDGKNTVYSDIVSVEAYDPTPIEYPQATTFRANLRNPTLKGNLILKLPQ